MKHCIPKDNVRILNFDLCLWPYSHFIAIKNLTVTFHCTMISVCAIQRKFEAIAEKYTDERTDRQTDRQADGQTDR